LRKKRFDLLRLSKEQRLRELQKKMEERELYERSADDPSVHNQVKVMEDKMPEREARKLAER